MLSSTPRNTLPHRDGDKEAERLLVEQAKTDPLAFGRLFDTYYNLILGYIVNRTADVYIAQELTSNVFYSAMKSIGKFHCAVEHVAAFSVSGTFTGSIDGRIRVGNQEVIVTDETSIYVSGEGKEDVDLFVRGASLYIGGMEKNGERTATFVVVRQSRPSFSQRSRSVTDSRYSVPSSSNPNVGQWVKGHE